MSEDPDPSIVTSSLFSEQEKKAFSDAKALDIEIAKDYWSNCTKYVNLSRMINRWSRSEVGSVFLDYSAFQEHLSPLDFDRLLSLSLSGLDINENNIVDSQEISSSPSLDMPVGSDAQAMARWNFVPYQILNSSFKIGVVAFHIYGINRVEFFLDGSSTPTVVTTPTLNSESDTIEYWISVDPSGMASGLHTLTAIAYPNVGLPRSLSIDPITAKHGQYNMCFIADPDNAIPRLEKYISPSGSDITGNGSSSNPFLSPMKAAKSIALANGGFADGGYINLLAGNHHFGTYAFSLLTVTRDHWLTIRPAPGVASADCPIVTATGGIRTKLVKFENITIKPNTTVAPLLGSPTNEFCCGWVDGCDFMGQGRTVNSKFMANWDYMFITSCNLTDSRDGFSGDLVRDCHIGLIGADAFTGSGLVINSTCRKIDRTGTIFHPDFYQLYAAGKLLENRILYGAELLEFSETQGLFSGAIGAPGIKDIAFVNVKLHTGPIMRAFQFVCPTNHMLVQGCTLRGSMVWRYDGGFTGKNIVFRGTTLTRSNGSARSSVGAVPSDTPITGVLYFD